MDRDIKLQDLDTHCRVCLGALCEIKHDVNSLSRSLTKLFRKYAGKLRNKFYPKYLCGQCFETLERFHDFQEKTKKANEFLKELLKPDEVEEFLTDSSSIDSTHESEASLPKSEVFQAANNDNDRIDNDPLLGAELPIAEFPNQINDDLDEKYANESDYEAVPVKVELKDADEELNLPMEKHVRKTNKCNVCDVIFADSRTLKSHMHAEHSDESTSSYDQSKRSFKPRSRLKLHKLEVHKKTDPGIACKFGCGKVFQRAQSASNHYGIKHSTVDEQGVQREMEEFISKNQALNDDENDKHNANDEIEKIPIIKKRMCTICFGLFSNNTALRKHMNTHKDVRPFQCDKCERGFNCKSRLQRHVKELHGDNPMEFVCKFGCGKSFKTSDSVGNHYRRQHSGKEIKPETPSYICEDCGRVFRCMTRLKQHRYQHRPIEDRPYQCDVCNKRFVFKKTYNEHLLRHKGIKEFECPQCGLKKTTKQELRNHMKYHTDELKVRCPICSKIFGNPPNLRRHIALVHEGVKNFKCQYCDEAFGKAETLKHHEMRHTGEKPHKCEICDKSFIQLVALRTHMKTHNKVQKATNKTIATAPHLIEPTNLMGISEGAL